MINKFFLVVKKIVFSAIVIYSYDSFFSFSNHLVSINVLTLSLVSFFGFFALFYLVLFTFI